MLTLHNSICKVLTVGSPLTRIYPFQIGSILPLTRTFLASRSHDILELGDSQQRTAVESTNGLAGWDYGLLLTSKLAKQRTAATILSLIWCFE